MFQLTRPGLLASLFTIAAALLAGCGSRSPAPAGPCGAPCTGADVCLAGTCGPPVRVTFGAPAAGGTIPPTPFAQQVAVASSLPLASVIGELRSAPGGAAVSFAFAEAAPPDPSGISTWVGTAPAIDPTNGATALLTVAARDTAWAAGAPDAARHQGTTAAQVVAVWPAPALTLPLSTPACAAPDAVAMDPPGVATLGVVRLSAAEAVQGGVPVSCGPSTLRIADEGLLVEAMRTNFVTAPDAPATETKTLPAQAYVARVEGPGGYAIAAGTAVATGLPCTVTASSPCRFVVATAGTVTWTVSGSPAFAQLEGAGMGGVLHTSRYHAGSTRRADDVTVQDPLPVGPWCVAMDATPFDAQGWQSTETRGFFDWTAGPERATAYLASSDPFLKMYVTDAAGGSRFWFSWVFLSNVPHEFRFGADNQGGAELWVDGARLVLDLPNGAGAGVVTATAPIRLGQSFGQYLNGHLRNVRVATSCALIPPSPFTVSPVPGTLAALGDSITGTVAGGGTPYPDLVAAQLGWPVLNAALSGRRTDQIRGIWGGGVRRQAHGAVILMGGINDLLSGKTAPEAFANLEAIVRQAVGEGRRVVLLTVLPFGKAAAWTPAREAERLALNAAILALCPETGATCVDAAADLDDGTGALKAALENGDGLHPNQLGHDRLRDLVRAVLP